ncbi:peptide ABC transporter ATP-binding protein [Fructilactobacillus lindneri]|uniref:ABC transporter, ATP-binding protein n=2 Tax=Fructilactobacillus lindneri TaxID=53444 RepID=A0A0R2JWC9_9LACO|nr:ABC transporter ATP-binding protein [Fructilactobacillus lindneri]ANZ57398.1 peptide ABC transporter ATP-binding protein [Fructilactobacillus lindneri]ANZ58664.1 peptide ABC transporter ATP-binding protein [Fructilactobacillus lindneri]KRN80006.1 ABC transporter, ATP-binding protein [Fructilactobacillus lindneri DSM 20690 = JCM 11027]POG97883.1 peptide ABC transporter ATP-binding protein [Fructilactobacillus lindneri]POG99215.1 peptide ABC transporter ATP-binding protein [Fructilactobacillu
MDAIKLTNVSKSFGQADNRFQVLDNINFTSKRGEVNIITGPSGSGKSTLLTIMGALRDPDEGTVLLENEKVANLSAKARDQFRLNQIGFILQAHTLVPYLTVRDQFVLVDKVRPEGNMSAAELQNLTDRLGVSRVVDHFPNELSGGQSQRVAIIRGIYTKPNIILADEPTASLDEQRVTEVCQLLSDLAKKENKTVVVVTHDERVNQYADHIYELVDGHLSEK